MFDPAAMPPPPSGSALSIVEYFQLSARYPNLKYEYDHGQIRAIYGGSIAHDDLAFNARSALAQAFRSGPCSAHGSDVRVQVSADTYYFPDVTVTCDVADRRRDNKVIRSPRLVVEILSPSTERVDRSSKRLAYQACPSIQEILLISQFAPHVEIFRRDSNDPTRWSQTSYEPDSPIMLESIDVSLTFDEIYQGINFDEPLTND